MSWARRSFVGILSFLLFVSLLGTAFSTSSYLAFGHPDKVESWLNQSNFYGHFVSNAIDQAKKSTNSTDEQGSVTLSDTAVQQAAESAFSPQLVSQTVKTILDANYAWLEGKTAQPSFTVDLAPAKQAFAQQVGQYVQDHINSLPVCTPAQLAALGNLNYVDPLNITCRPAQLSAQAEAAVVEQRILNNSNFLSNPVITANNINPNGSSQNQPYYQRAAQLPKFYKLGIKLPWIYAVVALLSAVGVVLVAAPRRRGWRRLGVVLAEAGVILVIVKFAADAVLNQVEKHLFNNASVGQLQQSLTSVLHLAKDQLVKIDLLFGIVYLLLAVIILVTLLATRNRVKKPLKPAQPADEPEATASQPQAPVPSPPATDLPPNPRPTGPPLPPRPPKKRPLIQ